MRPLLLAQRGRRDVSVERIEVDLYQFGEHAATAHGNFMSATRQRAVRQDPLLDVVDQHVTDSPTAHVCGDPSADHLPKRTERRGPGAAAGALG